MSENCSQSCSACSDECNERREAPANLNEAPHELSSFKKVIGIVSGKGGVGKSLVTSMLAVSMRRNGFKTAILDADVTGPSIPKAFGIKEKVSANALGLMPVASSTGISIMSANFFLENDTDPVIWRGPIISGMVKQFWTDVVWGDIDYMFIDMPPGTGDVPLTVFQSLKVDGIIIVTSPQELVSMIVSKAVNMAQLMNIPIIGLIENMAYVKCPDCSKEIKVFGDSHIEDVAQRHNIKVLDRLPIDPEISSWCDQGMIESFAGVYLDNVVRVLRDDGGSKMKIAVASDGAVVAQHFGHCESFTIWEIEDNQVVSTTTLLNPGHKPGFLPVYLDEQGVNVIIAGGMGAGAVDIFNARKINVITGAQGSIKEVIQNYLNGDLISSGSVCHEHQHQDECSHS